MNPSHRDRLGDADRPGVSPCAGARPTPAAYETGEVRLLALASGCASGCS